MYTFPENPGEMGKVDNLLEHGSCGVGCCRSMALTSPVLELKLALASWMRTDKLHGFPVRSLEVDMKEAKGRMLRGIGAGSIQNKCKVN